MTASTVRSSPTAILAEYASTLEFHLIPSEVIAHAKLLILDTVACALYGSTLPWGRIMIDFVREQAPTGSSTVLGTPVKVPPAEAALANGTFTHAFELDDLHKNALIHAGAVTFIPALALAEARPVDGRRFLAAVVAGCEVGSRVGLVAGLSQLKTGFHSAGTTGTFCSGPAAGRVIGLSPAQMIHCMGISGTQASGLMAAQHGSMVKRMHMGRAAQSGVYGALLAEKGFTGIADILEAPFGGFLSVLAPGADQAPLTRELGERWETLNIGFKPYSSCGSTHTSIDALLDIMREHPEVGPDSVDRIDLDMQTVTRDHVGWRYHPVSPTAAQLNVSYCLAVALRTGDVFVEEFSEAAITRPEYIATAERVHAHASADLDAIGLEARHSVRMSVTLKDGRTYARANDYARGSFKKPLTGDEVIDKYRRLAGQVLSERQVGLLYEAVMSLDRHPDAAGALVAATLA